MPQLRASVLQMPRMVFYLSFLGSLGFSTQPRIELVFITCKNIGPSEQRVQIWSGCAGGGTEDLQI